MKPYALLVPIVFLVFTDLGASGYKLDRDQYISREIERSLGGIAETNERKSIVENFLKRQLSLAFPVILKFTEERKIKNEAEGEQIGFMLMSELRNRSVQILSSEEQIELLRISLEITQKMSPFECAQFIKKQRTDEKDKGRRITTILTDLNVNDLRSYTDLHVKALELLLTKKAKVKSVTNERRMEIRTSFIDLTKSYAKKDLNIKNILDGKSFENMSSVEVCETGRSIITMLLTEDSMLDERIILYTQGLLSTSAEENDVKRTAPQIPSAVSRSVGVPDSLVWSYQRAVSERIKTRIAFNPEDLGGNPVVTYLVTQELNGVIVGVELVKSSGSDKWDQAVEKAIKKSSPLPLASDGSVERRLELRFTPKERTYVPRAKVSEPYAVAYIKTISEHIKRNILDEEVPSLKYRSEQVVVFSIRQDAQGNVMEVRKTEGSGHLDWDHVVERAIWKSSPLPFAEDSSYMSHFSIPF